MPFVSPLRAGNFVSAEGLTPDEQIAAQQAFDDAHRGSLGAGLYAGALGLQAGSVADQAQAQEQAQDPNWQATLGQAQALQQQAGSALRNHITSYQDINGVGDALDYAGTQFGQGAASMAPTLATGLAAGLATRFVPGAGLLAKAIPYAAATLPAYAMERGEATLNQYNDPNVAALPVAQRASAATQKGAINALAEAAVPGMLGHGLLRPGKVLGTIGESILTEGATEGVQERVGQASQKGLINKDSIIAELGRMPTDQEWTNIIDAAAAGALTGGGVSTPTALSHIPANLGKFGLDKASEKYDTLFGGKNENPVESDQPVDLKNLSPLDRLKSVLPQVDPEHESPTFVQPKKYATPEEDMTDLPNRVREVAGSIIDPAVKQKWVPEPLANQAAAMYEATLGPTPPTHAEMRAFLAEAKKQDYKNAGLQYAHIAADKAAPLVEKSKSIFGSLLDKGKALVSGTKANLQAPNAQTHDDIAQIIFEHLKPELQNRDDVLKTLPDIATKVDLLSKLSEHAVKQGLTLGQLAQSTGRLSVDDLHSLDVMHPLSKIVADPKSFVKALKGYANVDAIEKGMKNFKQAEVDAETPGSTIQNLIVPAYAPHAKLVGRILDRVANDEKIAPKYQEQLVHAFGSEEKANLVKRMYERIKPAPKPVAEARIRNASVDTGATEDTTPRTSDEDAPDFTDQLTEKEAGSKVSFEYSGAEGTPYRLDTTALVRGRQRNALRAEINAERKNDISGGFVARPNRRVVHMVDVAEELHPGDTVQQDAVLARHAKKIINAIHETTDKGAAPELVAQREVDRARLKELGFDQKVTLKSLADKMPEVRKLMRNYGAKRVELPNSGLSGTGATFRALHAAGRIGVRKANSKKLKGTEAAKKLKATQFTYQRMENGKAKKVTLSADSLSRKYRVPGETSDPNAMFHEALADLLLSDPAAVPNSLQFPPGFTILAGGEPFNMGGEQQKPHTPDSGRERVAAKDMVPVGLSDQQRKGFEEAMASDEVKAFKDRLETAVTNAEARLDSMFGAGSLKEALEGLDSIFAFMRRESGVLLKAAKLMHPENADAKAEYLDKTKTAQNDPVVLLLKWAKAGKGRAAVLRVLGNDYYHELQRLTDERMVALQEAPREVSDEEFNKPQGARTYDETTGLKEGTALHPSKDDTREQTRTQTRRGERLDNAKSTTYAQLLRRNEVAQAMVQYIATGKAPAVAKTSEKALDAQIKYYQQATGPHKANLALTYERTAAEDVDQLFQNELVAQKKAQFAREKAAGAALKKTADKPSKFEAAVKPEPIGPIDERTADTSQARPVVQREDLEERTLKAALAAANTPATKNAARAKLDAFYANLQVRRKSAVEPDIVPDPTKGRAPPAELASNKNSGVVTPLSPAKKLALQLKMRIHEGADKLGIKWNNDEAFMDRTEALVGKRHLDDMTNDELEQVGKALKNWAPKQAAPKLSAQRPGVNSRTPAENRVLAKAIDAMLKRLQADGKNRFTTHPIKVDGKVAMGTYTELSNEIRVSLAAMDPMSVAYHEALHRFFKNLQATEEGRRVRAIMMRASSTPGAIQQLTELLSGHPEALGQIENDAEERAAYMFQFWAAGRDANKTLVKLSPALPAVFEAIAKYIRALFGAISDHEAAQKLFDGLYDGDFANRNLVAQVIEDKKLITLGDRLNQVAGPVTDAYKKLMLTATDRLRDFGVAALDELAPQFNSEAGHEGGALGFLPRRDRMTNKLINQMAGLFEGTTAVERKQALENFQAMKVPASPLELAVKQFLDDTFKYMEDSGVKVLDIKTKKWNPIKKIQGVYFPRQWDASAIAADERGFRDLLVKYGKVSPKQQDQIIGAIKTGDGQISLAQDEMHVGFTPFSSALENRELDFIDAANAAEFAKYQSKDLGNILRTYAYQAAHRAEFTRAFDDKTTGEPGKVLKDAVERAARDLPKEKVAEAKTVIKGLIGTLGTNMNPNAKQLMSAAITAENVILLPLTMFSQFIDALGVGLRSGDMKDAFQAFSTGIAGLGKQLMRQKQGDDEYLAESLGLISEQTMLETMGIARAGSTLESINKRFFRWNGMDQWNRSMRVAAMVAGERFMLKNKGEGRYMRELGLDPAHIMELPGGRVALTREQMAQLDQSMTSAQLTERERAVQEAMFRFVDGAVLRPNAAHRPVWGSDPHFMLLFHLKQFTFSFQKTIIQRTNNERLHGREMPALMLMAYVPVTLASVMAKSMLTGVPIGDGTFMSTLWYSVGRSGIMGTSQFGTDAFGDLHRGLMPFNSFLGPSAQHAQLLGEYVAGDPKVSTSDVLARSVPFGKILAGAPHAQP